MLYRDTFCWASLPGLELSVPYIRRGSHLAGLLNTRQYLASSFNYTIILVVTNVSKQLVRGQTGTTIYQNHYWFEFFPNSNYLHPRKTLPGCRNLPDFVFSSTGRIH